MTFTINRTSPSLLPQTVCSGLPATPRASRSSVNGDLRQIATEEHGVRFGGQLHYCTPVSSNSQPKRRKMTEVVLGRAKTIS